MSKELDLMRKVIDNNENIVLVCGSEVFRECGLNGIRAEHLMYDIEEKYGYSGEEIVTPAFLSRRAGVFYDYYQNIILNFEHPQMTDMFRAATALEGKGKLTKVVTRAVYEAFQVAGCENVVSLYGSVEKNRCPVCGKEFGSRYIKDYKGIPKCDTCGVILRPGFSLFGEQLDNARLTEAVNAIENANVLIVAGISLNSMTWRNMLRYYSGNKLLLLNHEEKEGDERATHRAYGNIEEMFKFITRFC